MNLIQNLISLKQRGLKVEPINDTQSANFYVIKTKKNKLVALGMEVDDTYHNTSIDNSHNEMASIVKHKIYNDYLPTIKKLKDEGYYTFIFYISDFHITFNRYCFEIQCEKTFDSITPLLETIVDQLPELKTKAELINDELIELKGKYQYLSESIKDLQEEDAANRNKIIELKQNISTLEYHEDELNKKLNIELKKSEYLISIVKESTIKNLSEKQKEYLIQRNNNESEVNLDLFYPTLLVEYNTTKSVAYDYPSDWISLNTVEYILVDKEGNSESITKDEISKNSKFCGFHDFKGKVIGCFSIRKDELK